MTERDERTGLMASACRRNLSDMIAAVGHGRAALRRALLLAALLAFAVNAVVWLVASGFLAEQAERNDLLKERIGELDQQSLRIRDAKERTSALLTQAEVVAQLLSASDRTVLDLHTVAGVVRDVNAGDRNSVAGVLPSVRLNDLEIARKGVILRGETSAPAGVSELLRRLQVSGYEDVRLSQLALFDMPQPGLQIRRSFVIETGGRVDVPARVQPATTSDPMAPRPPPAAPEEEASSVTLILLGGGGLFVCMLVALLWFIRKRIMRLLTGFGNLRAMFLAGPSDRLAGRRRFASVEIALQRLRLIDPANPDDWPPRLRVLVVIEVFLLAALMAFSLGVSDTLDELEAARRDEFALRDAYHTKHYAFGADKEKLYVEHFAAAERSFGADADRIPSVPDDVGLLAALERIAGERKVSLSRLQKESSERFQASHATQTWSLHVSGSFSALGGMLEDIGQIGQLVSLAGLRLRPLANTQSELLLEGLLETHRRLSEAELASLKAPKKGKK